MIFKTATEWVALLADTQRQGRLDDELKRLERYPLIICDEVGYIPFDPQAANLMFMLVSRRYERASLIVTSNKPFGAWGEIFGDEITAAAMVDRLVHHAEILSTQRRQLPPQRPRPRPRHAGRKLTALALALLPTATTLRKSKQPASLHRRPRDRDRRLTPTPAIDLASLGQNHATTPNRERGCIFNRRYTTQGGSNLNRCQRVRSQPLTTPRAADPAHLRRGVDLPVDRR